MVGTGLVSVTNGSNIVVRGLTERRNQKREISDKNRIVSLIFKSLSGYFQTRGKEQTGVVHDDNKNDLFDRGQ